MFKPNVSSGPMKKASLKLITTPVDVTFYQSENFHPEQLLFGETITIVTRQIAPQETKAEVTAEFSSSEKGIPSYFFLQ